jgi:hypothetical protein
MVCGYSSSLSDSKEIGCKFAWPVHISPLFWAIERLLPCKIVKICAQPNFRFDSSSPTGCPPMQSDASGFFPASVSGAALRRQHGLWSLKKPSRQMPFDLATRQIDEGHARAAPSFDYIGQ